MSPTQIYTDHTDYTEKARELLFSSHAFALSFVLYAFWASSCWARYEPSGSCAASCALYEVAISMYPPPRRASSRSLRARDLQHRVVRILFDILAAVVLMRCRVRSGPLPASRLDFQCR